MHKALNPRDDIRTIYESRKAGGSELAGIEDRVDESRWLEDFIKKKELKQSSVRSLST